MIINIFISIVLLLVLWYILRQPSLYSSLGLPFAYLIGLQLIHLPGAYAHALPWSNLQNTHLTETGFALTTLSSFCFVLGVWLSRRKAKSLRLNLGDIVLPCHLNPLFLRFCLVSGWISIFVLLPFSGIPTIGAFVKLGSNIWMLAIVLAMPLALQSKDIKRVALWLSAMFVFPVFTLIFSGFISYGSAAIINCLSFSFISARKARKAMVIAIIVSFLGISFFLSYFTVRDDIRKVAWSGAEDQAKITVVSKIFDSFAWIDPYNLRQLKAMNERLNQNYFVGLAVERLQAKAVDYLNGKSISDGFLSLIPRVIWTEKTVTAGSGRIVADVTGLNLSATTSFGVGNVMEAYINFAIPGIVIGFVLFGYLLGWLDLHSAIANLQGNTKTLIRCFLTAIAIIIPNGSFVEMVGGGTISWIAAIYWQKIWQWWSGRSKQEKVRYEN
jgi:O-antigen polysaccharide polymerase Wzy